MRRLAETPELLDGPLEPDLLAGNLRDLARVNRWLGGASLSLRALRMFATPHEALRVLDVGTGDADLPKQLFRRAAYSSTHLELTAIDIRTEIVELARRNVGRHPITVKLSSPDRIDEPDSSFEVVHASLVLHHLDPREAVASLREMARVATRAVIVNDLERGRVWWLGAWLLTRVATGNRYTRNDAPLSVRRAYHSHEVERLATHAGLKKVAQFWARPGYRYALVFSKQDQAGG